MTILIEKLRNEATKPYMRGLTPELLDEAAAEISKLRPKAEAHDMHAPWLLELHKIAERYGCPAGEPLISWACREIERLSQITEARIEAAAIAIYSHGSFGQPWEKYPPAGKERLRAAAKDALAAAMGAHP